MEYYYKTSKTGATLLEDCKLAKCKIGSAACTGCAYNSYYHPLDRYIDCGRLEDALGYKLEEGLKLKNNLNSLFKKSVILEVTGTVIGSRVVKDLIFRVNEPHHIEELTDTQFFRLKSKNGWQKL